MPTLSQVPFSGCNRAATHVISSPQQLPYRINIVLGANARADQIRSLPRRSPLGVLTLADWAVLLSSKDLSFKLRSN